MMRPLKTWFQRRNRSMNHGERPFAASRTRLLVTILGVVSAILLIMAVAVYLTEVSVIDQQVNYQIKNWANHEPAAHYFMEQQNYASQSNADGDGGPHDFAPVYQPTTPSVFSVAIDAQDNVIFDPTHIGRYGLPDVSTAQAAMRQNSAPSFITVTKDGYRFRLYNQVVTASDGQIIGVIQSGSSLDPCDRQLRGLVMTLIYVGIGVLALTAGASILLAEYALVPTRQAFDRQQRFVAAASHELRTPLAIMRSQAELITRRLQGSASTSRALSSQDVTTLKDDTQEILTEVDYMTRLIKDLLLLARSPNERQSITPTTVDLRALAADLLAKTEKLPDAHALRMRLDVPDAAVTVAGDADRLRQLILILLDNALQYTPPGGEVRVHVWQENEHALLHRGRARLSVSDTGVGIAPEHLRQIFEPFFRADAARTHRDGRTNTGLGLTLAQWIAEAHEGNLTVTSAPGQGSTFTIDLPLATVAESAPLPQSRPAGNRVGAVSS